MTDDRHYKPTTHQQPDARLAVSETKCHYTSPGQDVCRGKELLLYRTPWSGWSGEGGATNVSERVGRSPSPGSGMHATAYFRGNKDRRKVLTDMLFSICGAAVWHPDIDLCNRYIVYRISFNITNRFYGWHGIGNRTFRPFVSLPLGRVSRASWLAIEIEHGLTSAPTQYRSYGRRRVDDWRWSEVNTACSDNTKTVCTTCHCDGNNYRFADSVTMRHNDILEMKLD